MTGPVVRERRTTLDRTQTAEVFRLNRSVEVRAGDTRITARDALDAYMIREAHNRHLSDPRKVVAA